MILNKPQTKCNVMVSCHTSLWHCAWFLASHTSFDFANLWLHEHCSTILGGIFIVYSNDGALFLCYRVIIAGHGKVRWGYPGELSWPKLVQMIFTQTGHSTPCGWSPTSFLPPPTTSIHQNYIWHQYCDKSAKEPIFANTINREEKQLVGIIMVKFE